MKTAQNSQASNLTVRSVGLAISVFAVVGAMESVIAGSALFALINVAAIALATFAIIGSDAGDSRAVNATPGFSRRGGQPTNAHA